MNEINWFSYEQLNYVTSILIYFISILKMQKKTQWNCTEIGGVSGDVTPKLSNLLTDQGPENACNFRDDDYPCVKIECNFWDDDYPCVKIEV